MHPSRVPDPFWPNRVADRTPITTEGCVFRRGLKSGPREPQRAEDRTRTFFEGSSRNRTDLPKISQNTDLQKTMCFTRRNGRRAKSGGLRARNGGRVFSKSVARLQRQGPAGTKATPRSVPQAPGAAEVHRFLKNKGPLFGSFFSLRPFGLVKHNGLGTFVFLHL